MYDWAAVLRSLGLGEEKCDWEGRWNDASHSPEGRRHWREGQWEEEEYMHMHNTLPGTWGTGALLGLPRGGGGWTSGWAPTPVGVGAWDR